MNGPVPFTLMVLPPGLAAVPKSSVPPLTAMAGSLVPVDDFTTSFRRVRLPPVTRMVGASPVVTKVTLETTTFPDVTVNAGESGSMVVPATPLMYSVIPVDLHRCGRVVTRCQVEINAHGYNRGSKVARAERIFTTSLMVVVSAWMVRVFVLVVL